MRTARPKYEQRESKATKARFHLEPHLAQTLARMPHTKREVLRPMPLQRQPNVPVYSADRQPLMPCPPKRARKLMEQGRAVPHHIRGIFGIRLLDKTRKQCQVQDVTLNIDPGSNTSGMTLTTEDEAGKRTVVGTYQLKHRAFALKATMTRRRSFRRTRRYRLRYRKPRFDNRRRKPGTLPPSVDSLRHDTMRLVSTLILMYPISSISAERNKFDPQLMQHPDIKGVEYQQGTLLGSSVRAYVFERDHNRCIYCRRSRTRLELDHVRPRAAGSDRVGNLVVSCRECNVQKDNRPIEDHLADRPDLLARILRHVNGTNLVGAAHVNAALPATVRDLWTLGIPLISTDAATVAWNRHRFNVPKTHCYDTALHGSSLTSIENLPSMVTELKPNNGRSKQKANIDRHGTPIGKPFRQQQRLPKHLRQRNPAAGHSDRHQRHGKELISTGDTVEIKNQTGRAVIKARGTRVALHRTKPQVSAKIADCSLIARRSGYTISRKRPSQQEHSQTA